MAGGGGLWPSVQIVLALLHDNTLVGARRVFTPRLHAYVCICTSHARTRTHARTHAARTCIGGMKGGIEVKMHEG